MIFNAMGITYKADCLLNANKFIERFLCGETWQQTQINKIIFVVAIIVILSFIGYTLYRRFFKKR